MDEWLSLPDSTDRLVLEPTDDGYCKVVVMQRSDGSRGWTASPPGGEQDAWVRVRLVDGTLLANSFSGWLIRFDPETGRELERQFTK